MATTDSKPLDQLIARGPALDFDGAWALSPAALAHVTGAVAAGRKRVIECGSGLSTLVLARLLSRDGAGHLWSLEHDPVWAQVTRERLAAEGLGEWTTLIEAPLRPHPLAQPGCGWYEQAALEQLPAEGVELLLVDGPPADTPARSRSRYPALPLLASRLVRDALIVLDDAERPGESWVLERWERELSGEFERRTEGIAVGTIGLGPYPSTSRED